MGVHMTNAQTSRELQELWIVLFPNVPAPDEGQWALWQLRHSPDVVQQGIATLGLKFRKLGGQMDALYMARFASSVMNRLTAERVQKGIGEKAK